MLLSPLARTVNSTPSLLPAREALVYAWAMDREARIAESAMRLRALINKLFPKAAADVIGYVLGRRAAFALRGRPWDLYRRFLLRFPYPQRQHEIEHLCAQMLGVEQRVSLRDGWREEVSPQFGDRGPLSITGFHQVLDVSSRPAEESCDHASAMPTFDAQAAEGLGAREVRLRWPRFEGSCPTCGARVLCYASFEHYLAGDW